MDRSKLKEYDVTNSYDEDGSVVSGEDFSYAETHPHEWLFPSEKPPTPMREERSAFPLREPEVLIDDFFRVAKAIGLVTVWAITIAFSLASIVLMFKGAVTFSLFFAGIALLFRPWVGGGAP